jgi:hypothetical protein
MKREIAARSPARAQVLPGRLLVLCVALAVLSAGCSILGGPPVFFQASGVIEIWYCPILHVRTGERYQLIDLPAGFVSGDSVSVWLRRTESGSTCMVGPIAEVLSIERVHGAAWPAAVAAPSAAWTARRQR